MKKRIVSLLLSLLLLISVVPISVSAEGNYVAWIGTKGYETLDAAIKDAQDSDTIQLVEGNYATYIEENQPNYSGKNLTFEGKGNETVWQIGAKDPNPDLFGTEYNGDYSFDGRGTAKEETVTFKNINFYVGTEIFLGFIGIDNFVLENCTVNGIMTYGGTKTAKYEGVVFNAPTYAKNNKSYYSFHSIDGDVVTFKDCTFNGDGKFINVYSHYEEDDVTKTINFDSCTVNSTGNNKQPLNIKNGDSTRDTGHTVNWEINISGHNVFTNDTTAENRPVNKITCSRWFSVQKDSPNPEWDKIVTVKIDGTPVWQDGKMVKHAIDTANDKYTDGYKDNAFDILKATDWDQQSDGSYKREITRVCRYCKYKETVVETKRDEVDDITAVLLPALQANTDDHYSYLIGYADGTVRPNGKITRAEVATIFFRLLDDDTRAKYWSSENDFSDVSADKWYNNAVSTLSNMGVIGGYADGTFRPDAPISRAEFAKIAVSFTQNNGSAVYNYFTDVKTTDWFAPYVTAAKDAGLIEGYSDGSFKPESKITRAEACAIVNRTLGRKPSKAHMKISGRIDWPDVQTTDWFYEAIMEATNSHTCTMGDRVETWTGKLPQRDWATLETGWANAYTGR